VPDLQKARRVFGYAPQVALEEGLRRTIAWCAAHNFVQAPRAGSGAARGAR
jgi:nucleoside-diphosphate-sugar epimerase